MPKEFRIATFNVENLFSRAKLLNLANHEVGDSKLQDLAQLRKELGKVSYDKEEILRLYKSLKDYIGIEETREKLFKRKGYKVVGVKANGKKDVEWVIKLKPDKIEDEAIKNTARVIKKVNADVICIIEVEDHNTLKKFNSDRKLGYNYSMLIEGNDPRGIDVALLSRFQIGTIRTHIFDRSNGSKIFSRDCLEVQVLLPNGMDLWLLINHFKSKGYGTKAKNNSRRKLQAQTVTNILSNEYNLNQQLVVVAGDFNDTPDSNPLQPLLSRNDLHDCLALEFPNSPDDRWTYHYKSNQQFDYLLVSHKFKKNFRTAGIERRGIYDVHKYTNGAIRAWSSVQDEGYIASASDHGAVWADFQL